MSTRISWQSYLTASLVILAVYYTALFVLYYRKGIFPLANTANPGKNKQAQRFSEPAMPFPKTEPPEINLSAIVQNSLDELNALVLQASADGSERPAILQMISHCLKKYPAITDPAVRGSLNHLIAEAVAENCHMQITEEELTGLW